MVTLLFSDVEGSTRLVQRLGEAVYAESLAEHRRLLREAVGAHAGRVVDCRADELFAVFPDAVGAMAAAVAAQQGLAAHEWAQGAKFRVRIGLNTGDPIDAAEGYVGLDVNRAARICAAGHGGQVLASRAVLDAAGSGLDVIDLGDFQLAGLPHPERILQVVVPDARRVFPALRASQSPAIGRRGGRRRRRASASSADAPWMARSLLPRVSEELRRPLADLAASLFTAGRAADRASVFLDRVDHKRLDSQLEAQREMTPFSKRAEREAQTIEAQIAAIDEVEGRLQTLREFTSQAEAVCASDPQTLTEHSIDTHRQRIADTTVALDDTVTRTAVLVGPLAFRLKRTRSRGVYQSAGRFVVPYIDTVGADRIRDFETLAQAREFRAAVRIAEQRGDGSQPYRGGGEYGTGF
jgi:class 3 adenylate cyclase